MDVNALITLSIKLSVILNNISHLILTASHHEFTTDNQILLLFRHQQIMFMYERDETREGKSYKYLCAPTTKQVHMCEDVKKHAFH